MNRLTRGLLLAAALVLLPTVAVAAEPPTTTVHYDTPTFPTPFAAAIVGLSFTAVVVVGARAAQRSSGTMMYAVLASLALTATFVGAAHKIHTDFDRTATQLHQTAAR